MKYLFVFALSLAASLTVAAQDEGFEKRSAGTGQPGMTLTMEESTAAISVITAEQFGHRTAKNIGNSVIGQGLGLISLQGAGRFSEMNPTFYVRGLQTLNGNSTPLILVDGIERDIRNISAEEVEHVSILKDAAATALYGYKGINGAILITTRRGRQDTRRTKIRYDHMFNRLVNKPDFVDGYTYGLAINEARANDGLTAMYSDRELAALKSGQYPDLYPSVNWVDETFRNTASTDNLSLEFSGGRGRLRYFALLDLISDRGFINGADTNEGYSTQDKYARGNMRLNLDIDLTPTTDLRINLLGMLLEDNRPGANINPWDMVYTIPSAAFPVRDTDGFFAGSANAAWPGTMNPVGQTRGAAYYKNHNRLLFSDITINQDLSSWTPGLSAFLRVSYDNAVNMYENHSKTYVYHVNTPNWPADAAEPLRTTSSYGTDSAMGTDSGANSYSRRAHVDAGIKYDFEAGRSTFKTQLKYDYDYEDINGINRTVYRQNISFWGHFSYGGKLLADLVLTGSGSSRLAPGTKWNFSPVLSLGWVISRENFLGSPSGLDFLKLRASAGILNADYLPDSNAWDYYVQQYAMSGGVYPFNSSYNSDFGRTYLNRLATTDPAHERAMKLNIGLDGRFLGGLTLTADVYFQRRSGIWVSAAGKYTDLIGQTAPYENAGVVDSRGIELGLNYGNTWGDFTLDLGGNFNLNRSKIVDMLEEPRLYDNLIRTGNRVDQIYGLNAVGFFRDEADIAASPVQTFSTVRPGDIKYEDVNKDGIVDENDIVAIGSGGTSPEVFYNFHLGAEWKGLGFYALFQGAASYGAVLNTKSMYYPLVGDTTISRHYYDNRWTPSGQDALYPALSSQDNLNNYQNNTLFLADRSFLKLRNVELYYRFREDLLARTRFIQGARIYVRGNDLLSFDRLAVSDPEAYGTSQLFRSVVAGVTLTF